MKKHLIGIDPSFKTMGVAVWTPETREVKFYSGKLQHCLSWIFKNYNKDEFLVVAENPNLDSPNFTLWQTSPFFINDQKRGKGKPRTIFGIKNVILACIKTQLQRSGFSKLNNLPVTIEHVRSAFSSAVRKAQDVGKSKAAGEFIIDILRERGIGVAEVAPSARHRADKSGPKNPAVMKMKRWPTKATRAQFQEWSGLKIGARDSNEHSRDAATLVVNRTIQNVDLQIMEQSLKRRAEAQERKRLKNYK